MTDPTGSDTLETWNAPRRELRSLELADKIARDALKTMVLGSPPSHERIGRYRVTGVIGEGGMGVVFRAHDDELARPVAIKLLRRRGGGERLGGARLLREAQALARLSHPNVVQVHDVGEHDGQVFIAMELIRGKTLREWLVELGATRGREREREIVARFVEAGRGLAAAHAAGLVHRDFKPANVLVGDDGRVRVVDFGLAWGVVDGHSDAKVDDGETQREVIGSDDTARIRPQTGSVTATGTILGTLAYISPEQLHAEPAGAASDQFSFCVALHEALLGVRPFMGASIAELSDNMRAGRRSSIPRGVAAPPWLMAILDRGLRLDSERRWPSMHALLEALLDDPVYRRRRRFVLAGAALLAGGLIGGAWGLDRHERSRCEATGDAVFESWSPEARASLDAAFAGSRAPGAADTGRRVAARLDLWVESWRAARVDACLDARNETVSRTPLPPSTWPGPGTNPGSQRELCLDRQRWQLDSLLEVLADGDPGTVQRAVSAAAALPLVSRCSELGWLAAERAYASTTDAEDQLRKDLVRVFVLERAGRYAEALTLAEASVAAAGELGDVALEAEALRNLGGMRMRTDDLPGAEQSLRAAYFQAAGVGHDRMALEAADDLIGVTGQGRARLQEAHDWVAHARMTLRRMGLDPERDYPPLFLALGDLHVEEGDYGPALAAYERALELMGERLDPSHPDMAIALTNIGHAQRLLGRYERALVSQRRALEIDELALGPAHPDVAMMHENIAVTLGRLARYDESVAEHRLALQMQELALGPDHADLGATLNNLADVLRHQGEYAEAEALLQRALRIYEDAYGPQHPEVAAVLGNLASATAHLGRPEGAIELLGRALAIKQAALGPEHPRLAVTLVNLGMRQQEVGALDDALDSFRRALDIDEVALGSEHPEYAADLDSVGVVLHALGEDEQALDHHERARAIRERVLPVDHPDHAASLDNIGVILRARGQLELAVDHHRRALGLRERANGPAHRLNATSLINLGAALSAAGEHQEASEQLGRASRILDGSEGDEMSLATAFEQLARVREAQGEGHAARSLLTRAVELRATHPGDPATLAAARSELARLGGAEG